MKAGLYHTRNTKYRKETPSWAFRTISPPCISKCSVLTYPSFCVTVVNIFSDRLCENLDLQNSSHPPLRMYKLMFCPSGTPIRRARVMLSAYECICRAAHRHASTLVQNSYPSGSTFSSSGSSRSVLNMLKTNLACCPNMF